MSFLWRRKGLIDQIRNIDWCIQCYWYYFKYPNQNFFILLIMLETLIKNNIISMYCIIHLK